MNSLKDKIAIVTGGAGGIGSASAMVLAERGAKVMVADRRAASVDVTVGEIQSKGGWARPLIFDLLEEDQIRAAMDKVAGEFGRIDILYNCAADVSPETLHLDKEIDTTDPRAWERALSINLMGTMLCCKYALPHMPRHAGASIINTASNTGLQGYTMLIAYNCSKAAIMQLTRNIAASHGRLGIRCNAISPGMILTQALLDSMPKAIRDIVESGTLLPSLGQPNDIAYVVAFLASDEARHITGQNIVVDGGLSVHDPGFAQLRALAAQEAGPAH
jgi:NAD(P)-dependent dehydrogenase (short-subunit alcohol dehydrogenase family)